MENKMENKENELLKRLSIMLNAYQDIEDAADENNWEKVKNANSRIGSQLKDLLPE